MIHFRHPPPFRVLHLSRSQSGQVEYVADGRVTEGTW